MRGRRSPSSGCWAPTSQAIAASFHAAMFGGACSSVEVLPRSASNSCATVPALSSGVSG